MEVRRFEKIDSLNRFLVEAAKQGNNIKNITVSPHDSVVFYVFYEQRETERDVMISKIIDIRNSLVREEHTLENLMRSLKKEKMYWQSSDSHMSKRISDYLSWIEEQLNYSAISIDIMMRETKELLMRRY